MLLKKLALCCVARRSLGALSKSESAAKAKSSPLVLACCPLDSLGRSLAVILALRPSKIVHHQITESSKMARIPLVREDDPGTPPEAREFLKRVEGGLGEIFNAVRLLANHPQQASALIGFVRSVRHKNKLTPTLTELAYTTASVVSGCHY